MTTLTEVFPCFFLSCKANARVKPTKMGAARTLPNFCVVLCIFLCCSMYFCVVLCIACFVMFSVLFVCICVLNYCHWVATPIAVKYIISYISNTFILNTAILIGICTINFLLSSPPFPYIALPKISRFMSYA